jgi:hypothetical protein
MKLDINLSTKKISEMSELLGPYYNEDPEQIQRLIVIAVTREIRRAREAFEKNEIVHEDAEGGSYLLQKNS